LLSTREIRIGNIEEVGMVISSITIKQPVAGYEKEREEYRYHSFSNDEDKSWAKN